MHNIKIGFTFDPTKTTCKMKPTEIIIETEYQAPKPLVYVSKGTKVTIGINDVDFFEKLQCLPTHLKIHLMQLSETEMLAFISERKKSELNLLNDLFCKNWHWRSSGDPIDIHTHFDSIGMTFYQLKKRCTSKRPPILPVIQEGIELLAGVNSEMYAPEDYN